MSIILCPNSYLNTVDVRHLDRMADGVFEATSMIAIHPQDKRMSPQESRELRRIYQRIQSMRAGLETFCLE